ncbi:MAG: PDR/VanB family oxidoreductase [Pseudomonadota bacterium]
MQKVKVSAVRKETPDIVSLDLRPVNGEMLPPAGPGSHVDVLIQGSASGKVQPMVRQYSLCQSPAETDLYRIGVKLEAASRGGSKWVHEQVRIGDIIEIGEVRNNFSPAKEAGFHCLIAGGIGITPMLSMAQHLSAEGGDFQLEYFARSIEHAAYAAVLQASDFKDKVRFHLGLDVDQTRRAVGELVSAPPRNDAHLYVCGPAPFMGLVEAAASKNWLPSTIHREFFGAATGDVAADAGFTIRLARSGQEHHVASGHSIVQVLERVGIPIETSCRQGACGTCMVGLLEGNPDHRDSYLLPEEIAEGRCIITCVSRSKSPVLVLDL